MDNKREELGLTLKEMRESQNRTLVDISQRTLVDINDLQKIEDGQELDKTPVYYRLTIKKFYEEMGGNFEDIVEEVDKILPIDNTVFVNKQIDDSPYGQIKLTKSKKQTHFLNNTLNTIIISVIIIFVIGIIALTFLNVNKIIDKKEQAAQAQLDEQKKAEEEKAKAEEEAKAAEEKAKAEEEAKKNAAKPSVSTNSYGGKVINTKYSDSFEIAMSANVGSVTISINQGGITQATQTISKGKKFKFDFEADKTYEIYISYSTASPVELTFDFEDGNTLKEKLDIGSSTTIKNTKPKE